MALIEWFCASRPTGVVLVGAATRMPLVRDYVRQLTGLPPAEGLDPEECVALGAAVHAGLLQGMVSGLELMDGGYVLEQHGRTTGI